MEFKLCKNPLWRLKREISRLRMSMSVLNANSSRHCNRSCMRRGFSHCVMEGCNRATSLIGRRQRKRIGISTSDHHRTFDFRTDDLLLHRKSLLSIAVEYTPWHCVLATLESIALTFTVRVGLVLTMIDIYGMIPLSSSNQVLYHLTEIRTLLTLFICLKIQEQWQTWLTQRRSQVIPRPPP
jgi:hypothetical protein